MDQSRAVDKKILSVPIELASLPWDALLKGQHGNGRYIGVPRMRGGMRGGGIGGVLSTIMKMVPMFLSSPIGQQLVSTGKNIVEDVKSGDNLMASAKRRGREAVREVTGLGVNKRKRNVKSHSVKRKRAKRSVSFLS